MEIVKYICEFFFCHFWHWLGLFIILLSLIPVVKVQKIKQDDEEKNKVPVGDVVLTKYCVAQKYSDGTIYLAVADNKDGRGYVNALPDEIEDVEVGDIIIVQYTRLTRSVRKDKAINE